MEWTFAVCHFGIDRMEAAIGGCLSIGFFPEVWTLSMLVTIHLDFM